MYPSNIPQYSTLEQKCVHFCSNVVYCGIWKRCIVEFVRLVYSRVTGTSGNPRRLLHAPEYHLDLFNACLIGYKQTSDVMGITTRIGSQGVLTKNTVQYIKRCTISNYIIHFSYAFIFVVYLLFLDDRCICLTFCIFVRFTTSYLTNK